MEKHKKEKEQLLANFAKNDDDDDSGAGSGGGAAETAALRVMLMKMCTARGLSTAGCGKRLFGAIVTTNVKTIIFLPRQARDKHN